MMSGLGNAFYQQIVSFLLFDETYNDMHSKQKTFVNLEAPTFGTFPISSKQMLHSHEYCGNVFFSNDSFLKDSSEGFEIINQQSRLIGRVFQP